MSDRVVRSEFATTDPEVALQTLRQAYGELRMARIGDPARFEFRLRSGSTTTLSADFIRYTIGCQLRQDPVDYVMGVSVLRGGIEYASGGETVALGVGDTALYRIGPETTGITDGLDVAVLRLPFGYVAQVAATRTGIDPADFRFDAMCPVSPAMSRHWHNVSALAHREMHVSDSVLASPLVHAQISELVAVASLTAFPNTTMTVSYLPGGGRVAPAVIRRAMAYIDEHANQPLTTGQVAEAAGIGIRALQHGFARHVGTTPSAYLRRVRLERAHLELQAADATRGATVAAIARRWGFSKPSRFTEAYREAYGVPPSHTLRT